MPGKKKKGKGKGKKKGGGDGGLPPPPHLDDQRQGALEALLKFRINDKEDEIEQQEQETELYKGKNDDLREKNVYLRAQQKVHYSRLLEQAREHEDNLEKSPKVAKESVEQTLTEKLELAQRQKEDLARYKERIAEVKMELEVLSVELQEWSHFKDVTMDENHAKISSIKKIMEEMLDEEAQLQSKHELKVLEAEKIIEARTEVLAEREKQVVSERFLKNMDETTRGELSDNAWLKQEIVSAKESLEKLTGTVNSLEHRNITAIEMVTAERAMDIEHTRNIYLATNRKTCIGTEDSLKQAGDRSGLPSLVNIAKCTSEKGPGGQAGQLELKLLSLRGLKAPIIQPPETFHLPPLDQKLNSQKSIPSRSTWPVTNTMLKSVAE